MTMRLQTPYFFSLLLAAATLSTITSSHITFSNTTSSFASYVDSEVAPSPLRAFHKRSPEPEPEPGAGFEDFKNYFLGPANNGFPDSYRNYQLSEEPKAEAEARENSTEIYNEFSQLHIQARRSAEPEPEAEAEPIGKFDFYNYYPGQGWQDSIRSRLFNLKQRRSPEPEPEAEAEPIGKSSFKFDFYNYPGQGWQDTRGRRSPETGTKAFVNKPGGILAHQGHTSRVLKERRSAEPEPEAEAEAEPIGKSSFKFDFYYYYPGQGWQDTIRSGLFNSKERRSAEPEPEAEAIGKSSFKFDNYFNYPGQGWQDVIRSRLFNLKERRFAEPAEAE